MHSTDDRSAGEQGVVYEVRALTDRWVAPTAGTVISSHGTAEAAMASYEREPRFSTDGTGRSAAGNYVPKAVVRVDAGGHESMVLPRPADGGLLSWPYNESRR